MSEWITDRKPTEDDGKYVYSFYGNVCLWSEFRDGEPWKPIPKCEPYVWPKRYEVELSDKKGFIVCSGWNCVADSIPTREAAERIAEIYNEVMP